MAQTVADHEAQIEDLRREVRELANRTVIELNRLADRQTSDREYVRLSVENQLLKFEKRLLPPSSENDKSLKPKNNDNG